MLRLVVCLLAVAVLGCQGCARQSTPPPTTPPPLQPVVEETISSSQAGKQENAWTSGGGIDWGNVASNNNNNRGGSSSNNNRGSSNNNNRGSSNNNNRGSVTPQSVSRNELREISEDLFRNDVNAVGTMITLSPQGRTSSGNPADKASNDLFTGVSPRALRGPTVSALYALLDNYDPRVTAAERDTRQEKAEQDTFLNAVMQTTIMTKTEDFLSRKGLISQPLKDVLREIWFTPYPRHRRTMGSSGFEHVFVGETKNGEVSGFHNWVNFYKEEREGDLDYFGHMKTVDLGDQAEIILLKFKWSDQTKPFGSMFVGTSPELDMALFTICFYARPGSNCPVELNRHRFNIKTYYQSYRGKRYVGTAFPNI